MRFLILAAALILHLPVLEAAAPDTLRLAAHLSQFRKFKLYEFRATDFEAVQRRYLAWVDRRIAVAQAPESMNAELEAAGLLSDGPDTVDDMFERTYAGYLAKIVSLPVGDEQIAVNLGIHTGGYCNRDETLVLYERKSRRRLAVLNSAHPYSHGYLLSGFSIGASSPIAGRLIATSWIASNCTSNWNGSTLKIDRLFRGSVRNILQRSAGARNEDGITVRLAGNVVEFEYVTWLGDGDATVRTAIARYRVTGNRALRESPIATQIAGFLSEWLELDDREADRWSSPAAAGAHHTLTPRPDDLPTWERVALCNGPHPTWEITLRWGDPILTTAFLIRAPNAGAMQLVAVSHVPSAACREIPFPDALPKILAELPR